MDRYLALRNILLDALPTDAKNLYFQPPEGIKLEYPCIIYGLSNMKTKYADNSPYSIKKMYKITIIDKNPLSEIVDSVALLSLSDFDRFYVADELNHFVFNLYY
jgi:hypothetical protein